VRQEKALREAAEGDFTFFGTPDRWQFKLMNAAGLAYRVTERNGALVTPPSLGSSVEHVPRPNGWMFAKAPNPADDPRHPTFRRYRHSSTVLPDESSVTAALAAVHALRGRYPSSGEASPETPAEEGSWRIIDGEELDKFTIQHGSIGYWFITRQGGAVDPPITITALSRVTDHMAKVYEQAAPPSAEWVIKPTPATTNSGGPYFAKHPLLKFGASLMGGRNVRETGEHGAEIETTLGLPTGTAQGLGIASRSGPLRTAQDILIAHNGGWFKRGSGKGWRQRERVVMMANPTVNDELEPMFALLHEARKRIRGLWHAGSLDADLAKQYRFSYECDISGYDVNVPRLLQETAVTSLKNHSRLTQKAADYYLWAETLPLLTPSWSLQDELMAVNYFRGGTRSGLRLTAEMGTYMATTCSLHAMDQQGYDITEWPTAIEWALLHQGDDALILTNKPLDPEQWAASYAECGFTAELKASDVFLSKHQRARIAAPRLGRVIQQTLSNEHEVTGPPELTIGLQMLGLIGRCEGIGAMPATMLLDAWKTARMAAWIEECWRHGAPQTSLPAFLTWLSSDRWADEQMKASLEWVKGESWFESNVRNAEHSPIAAAVVAAATARGADVAGIIGLDGTLRKCVQAWRTKPWSERRLMMGRIAAAQQEGRKAMDDLWAEITVTCAGVAMPQRKAGQKDESETEREEGA
jgi:hypothetical protein